MRHLQRLIYRYCPGLDNQWVLIFLHTYSVSRLMYYQPYSRRMCPSTRNRPEVVSALATFKGALPGELDNASETEAVRLWLTQPGQEDGAPVARLLRNHATGLSETVPSTSDDLEATLACLALDTYPAFLLSPDPLPMPVALLDGEAKHPCGFNDHSTPTSAACRCCA